MKPFAYRLLLPALCLAMLGSSCSTPAPKENTNRCLLGAALVNPEANTIQTPGIGGTGQMAAMPGIGGTGQTQSIAETGIGGTGIVGIVTGFASICVNGEEVHYLPKTPVSYDGQIGSTRDIQVGQVVAVQAAEMNSTHGSQWQAMHITVQHAVVGPLTRIDKASGMVSVMNEEVQALSRDDLEQLVVGNWVRVSGHRNSDGIINAGRIQALPSPVSKAQIMGPLNAANTHTMLVGRTPVQLNTQADKLPHGQEILVRGHWDGQQLQVQETIIRPTHRALGKSSQVLLQGYAQKVHGNQLMLGYETVVLPNEVTLPERNQPVLIRGRILADQRIVAEQVVPGKQGNRGGFSHGNPDKQAGQASRRSGYDGAKASGSGGSSSGSGRDSSGGKSARH